MKRFFYLFVIFSVFINFTAFSQDCFLLPQKFFLAKGDNLDLHLLTANDFGNGKEAKYQAAKTTKFDLYEGSKKTDLLKVAKENNLPVLSYPMTGTGVFMFSMNRNFIVDDVDRDDFIKYVSDEGMDKMADQLKNSEQESFTEKYNCYLKTLVKIDKNSGFNEKPINDDLEIVLKQNPYKASYGDDITAVIYYKGKPLSIVPVTLYVKTEGGALFPQKLSTDATGQVFFKLSREGIYMLRAVHLEQAKGDKDADVDIWLADYTFAFSNEGDMPNTYKEFGFGGH